MIDYIVDKLTTDYKEQTFEIKKDREFFIETKKVIQKEVRNYLTRFDSLLPEEHKIFFFAFILPYYTRTKQLGKLLNLLGLKDRIELTYEAIQNIKKNADKIFEDIIKHPFVITTNTMYVHRFLNMLDRYLETEGRTVDKFRLICLIINCNPIILRTLCKELEERLKNKNLDRKGIEDFNYIL